jgi:hypothetical protein
MFSSATYKRAAAILATAAIGASATAALASHTSSGVTFTTLTTQNFNEAVQINSDRIKFQTKDPTIVRMQSATWNANSTSGWHSHPGVIIGVVTSGSITVWDGACNQKTYGPGLPLGAVFVEGDDELMQATSSGGANEYVTHFVPPGVPFREDKDTPACATSATFRVPPKTQ